MGILFSTVNMSNELKKQAMIQRLLELGITDHKEQSVYDMDYYELRHLLAVNKVVAEG